MTEEEVAPIIVSPNYAGACEPTEAKQNHLLGLLKNSRYVSGSSLFALKYDVLPCILNADELFDTMDSISDDDDDDDDTSSDSGRSEGNRGRLRERQQLMYHTTSVLDFLCNEYKADPNTFYYSSSYSTSNDMSLISNIYIDLGNYFSIQLGETNTTRRLVDNPNNLVADFQKNRFKYFSEIEVFHMPQSIQRAQKLLQQLHKFKLYRSEIATLKMVCLNSQGEFYISSFRMKKPHIIDLRLHYGDEFLDIHKQLLQALQEKHSSGIAFLHGPPGTGKTYYLRYLINEIKSKRLIYIPPDLVNDITKPNFLPFLMRYPNSILIIEDAENIIQDRKQVTSFTNQAVSNLLNLSDGLLGDAIHQQIICTFNCDVQGIDPALLRDGRLVLEHKFDKLSPENARRLCAKLNIPKQDADIRHPISLAEIYARVNPDKSTPTDQVKKNRRPVKKRKTDSDSTFGFYA